jgi:hypothetical protein
MGVYIGGPYWGLKWGSILGPYWGFILGVQIGGPYIGALLGVHIGGPNFGYHVYVSGYFLLPNRKYPDSKNAVGTFPIAQQEISRHSKSIFCCRDISCWAVGIFPVAQQEISRHAKSVGTFPIGVVGTFLVGCVGISTASVSGHFYRPLRRPI